MRPVRFLGPLGLLLVALAAAGPAAGQTVNAAPAEVKAIRDSLAIARDSICKIQGRRAVDTALRDRIANPCAVGRQPGRLARLVAALDAMLARPPIPAAPPLPADTSCVAVKMAPSSGPSVEVGGTQKFAAIGVDSAGATRGCAIAWRAGNPPVANVDQSGVATGIAPGFSDIYATVTATGANAHVPLEVRRKPPPDSIPPGPQPSCTVERVIADTLVTGNLVIPATKCWQIGRNVRVAGNVLVQDSKLVMRPGGSLTFVGGNPNDYTGGGLEYSPALDKERGLWVWGAGQLDIACTAKVAWNRTGSDPSWKATDEYWIAPTERGDFFARRWSPGQPVPRVDPRVPAAEVTNVTRDCSIEAAPAGHIHIHSSRVQRIEYVRLVNMGVSNTANQGAVTGRYALHCHMSGEGSRGSIIRGVAATGSKGRVFVPHGCHGVTMADNVSVGSYAEALWWDPPNPSHDFTFDHGLVLNVQMPDSIGGGQSNVDGVSLPGGLNTRMSNTAVAAVFGGSGAVCFDWPEPTAIFAPVVTMLVWIFNLGNVGHNCRGPAVRFWTNSQDLHDVSNFASYHNGGGCAENGAYFSATTYHNLVCFEDGFIVGNDYSVAPAAFTQNSSATGPAALTNSTLISSEGPAIEVGHRQLPATTPWLVSDMVLVPGPGAPKVNVGPCTTETSPWRAYFVRSGVTAADFRFVDCPGNEGSVVDVDLENGQKIRLTWTGGKLVQTPRP